MNEQTMKDLAPGDVVRGKVSGHAFMVVRNYGAHVTCIRTAEVTAPDEWELVSKVCVRNPPGAGI